MPTEQGKKKPQGFATFPKDKHRAASSAGGKKTGLKGYALLSKKQRSKNASMASRARWDRVKAERQLKVMEKSQ